MKIIAGAVAVAIVISIAGIVWKRSRAMHQAAATAAVPAGPVVASDLMLSGRVTARNVVNVAAPIEGTLETYFVEPGAQVFQGQLLGRISNPKLQEPAQKAQSDLDKAQARVTALTTQQLTAKLEESRAAADQSRAKNEVERLQKIYDRQEGLWKAGATARLAYEKTKKDYDDAKAELDKQDAAAKESTAREAQIEKDLEAANREVAAATAAIEKSKSAGAAGEIHSPVDGIVVARQEMVGHTIDPSMKNLISIGTDLTQLAVEVNDPRIHNGQAAIVRLDGAEYNGTVQDGKIAFNTPMPVDKLGEDAQVIIKF